MQRRIQRSAPALVLVWLSACAPADKQDVALQEAAGVGGSGGGEPGIGGAGGEAVRPGASPLGGAAGREDVGNGTAGGFGGTRGAPDAALTLDSGLGDGAAPVVEPLGSPADAGADAAENPAYVDAGPELDPELERRLSAISARLGPLAERTSAFWFEHGPDAAFGGFHGTLSRNGTPIAPDDKGLIQETRHLWMLSTWYERRSATPALAALAAETYSFIRESFVDTDGSFFFKVSRDGSRVVDAKKQLFAESYAIYALSTYGRVFGVEEATELALGRFESIDASRHDEVFGGYDQQGDPGFLTAGAEKDTNTHLHLLEAFTALYEATGEERVRSRLAELVELFRERLLQPAGYVHAEFSQSWAPFGAPRVSYGHDLETAWLLLDAARVLGQSSDEDVRSAALKMADHSARRGFDAARGAFFEAGVPGGAANDFDRIWWVQFEALAGLWWAYEVGADDLYLERLEATLGWVEESEDAPAGEWFATTNPDGTAAGADYKGDEWKASYHSVRALVFVQDWIDAELGRK